MRAKRVFDREFKERVIREILCGTATAAQIARRYGLRDGLISRWRKDYEHGPRPETEDVQGLRSRIAELERMVGRLTMENDFLKKFAAYTKQQTSARSSVITAKTLRASRPAAGLLGLPAARTITKPKAIQPANVKMPNLKSA